MIYFSFHKVILILSRDPEYFSSFLSLLVLIINVNEQESNATCEDQSNIEQARIISSNSAFAGDTRTGTFAGQ